MLLKFIRSVGVRRDMLLDIGGGVGAIQHDLAVSDAETIISVEASPAYIAAARSESERLGYAERASYIAGDFTDAADRVPNADLVTLDRVVCCYHDVEALLGAAASKAGSAVGLVYPREGIHVKVGMILANFALRLSGSDFRTFVHPHSTIERTLSSCGFRLAESGKSIIWRVALFTKPDEASPKAPFAS